MCDTGQEILDEKEYGVLNSEIRKTFDWMNRHKLTLDQLRRISAITKEPVKE